MFTFFCFFHHITNTCITWHLCKVKFIINILILLHNQPLIPKYKKATSEQLLDFQASLNNLQRFGATFEKLFEKTGATFQTIISNLWTALFKIKQKRQDFHQITSKSRIPIEIKPEETYKTGQIHFVTNASEVYTMQKNGHDFQKKIGKESLKNTL